jgi:hypothetical protein
VNYAGVVWLRARRVAEAEPREGAAAEARAVHEEIRADASPLFLSAGNGDGALIRALFSSDRSSPPACILCMLCFLASDFSCLHRSYLSLHFVCFFAFWLEQLITS